MMTAHPQSRIATTAGMLLFWRRPRGIFASAAKRQPTKLKTRTRSPKSWHSGLINKEFLLIAETPKIPERVDYWLTEWARWMYSEPTRLGYPHKSMGIRTGGEDRRTEDWEEDENQAIRLRNCEAMDALISDLPPAQCCAIRSIYAGDVWRFPRENQFALLERASATLLIGMNARAIL